MADAPAFDWLCSQLEARSSLNRLEARGTVRLALKESGLETRSVLPGQMRVVIEKVLPVELEARGIDDARNLCQGLATDLSAADLGDSGRREDSPEAVFGRLGGDR